MVVVVHLFVCLFFFFSLSFLHVTNSFFATASLPCFLPSYFLFPSFLSVFLPSSVPFSLLNFLSHPSFLPCILSILVSFLSSFHPSLWLLSFHNICVLYATCSILLLVYSFHPLPLSPFSFYMYISCLVVSLASLLSGFVLFSQEQLNAKSIKKAWGKSLITSKDNYKHLARVLQVKY